jgi:hypothetical protein
MGEGGVTKQVYEPPPLSFEDRVNVLLMQILYGTLTNEEVMARLDEFDVDDVRHISLTAQYIYKLAREVWMDRVTEPDDRSTTNE